MVWNWIERNILNFLLYTLQAEFMFRNNLNLKMTSDEAQAVAQPPAAYLPFICKINHLIPSMHYHSDFPPKITRRYKNKHICVMCSFSPSSDNPELLPIIQCDMQIKCLIKDHLRDFWICETRTVQQMAQHHDIYIIIIIIITVGDNDDEDVIHPLILSYKCLGLHKKYLHVICSWFIYWCFQLIKLYSMKW